ncbi:MAG: hypothetical protein OEY59_12855, partial [Deltaproteobacteria bacterium]|nr:hypothetical protein [Deltaproteobacteria bacterium]
SVVNRESIWDIEFVDPDEKHNFKEAQPVNYFFRFPYPFEGCPDYEKDINIDRKIIAPNHLIGDPYRIKSELDRLQKHHDQLKDYEKDKQFYAVPQVYGNFVHLGLWLTLGSRYGASKNRTNNFNPILISELSEGPFGYQHIIQTGSAPMYYSLHEESQSQFYYRMKADYIHFSFMYDYNRFLVGEEKYKWQKDDLSENDSRLNEHQHLAAGFDYNSYSVEYSLTSFQYAIRHQDLFFKNRVDLNKVGFFYQDNLLRLDFYYGFTQDGKVDSIMILPDDPPELVAYKERLKSEIDSQAEFSTKLRFYRLNFYWDWILPFKPRYNILYRGIDFFRDQDKNQEGSFYYQTRNLTQAVYFDYNLAESIHLNFFISLENQISRFGVSAPDSEKKENFIKAGGNMMLDF